MELLGFCLCLIWSVLQVGVAPQPPAPPPAPRALQERVPAGAGACWLGASLFVSSVRAINLLVHLPPPVEGGGGLGSPRGSWGACIGAAARQKPLFRESLRGQNPFLSAAALEGREGIVSAPLGREGAIILVSS